MLLAHHRVRAPSGELPFGGSGLEWTVVEWVCCLSCTKNKNNKCLINKHKDI